MMKNFRDMNSQLRACQDSLSPALPFWLREQLWLDSVRDWGVGTHSCRFSRARIELGALRARQHYLRGKLYARRSAALAAKHRDCAAKWEPCGPLMARTQTTQQQSMHAQWEPSETPPVHDGAKPVPGPALAADGDQASEPVSDSLLFAQANSETYGPISHFLEDVDDLSTCMEGWGGQFCHSQEPIQDFHLIPCSRTDAINSGVGTREPQDDKQPGWETLELPKNNGVGT